MVAAIRPSAKIHGDLNARLIGGDLNARSPTQHIFYGAGG